MTEYVELNLTCADQDEAEVIANALLEKKLVACAKFIPITSRFQWHDDIETNEEVLVLMESRADDFMEVEEIVAGLHSYTTFVLKAITISQISEGAAKWLTESLE